MVMPQLPDIAVVWDELEDAASDMALRAQVSADYLADAATAWLRFRDYYVEPTTQEQVYTALDDLKEPTENWQRSLQDASTIISDFVTSGRALAARKQELQRLIFRQQETDPDSLDESENSPANQATVLTREWTELQETTAAALAGIGYGDGAGLPMGAAPGGTLLPTVEWASWTTSLNEQFGPLNPALLLTSLTGLNESELAAWAAANPEAAALLANRTMMGPFGIGTPEAIMQAAMGGDADLSEQGIAGIRAAWTGLSEEDQERLLLLFPAVFGSLNGVPFAQRAKANNITVPGYRHTAEEELAALKEPMMADFPSDDDGAYEYVHAHVEWSAEQDRLKSQLKGLEYAVDNHVQVVMVSMAGNGQVVSMTGAPSPDTTVMSTVVPGTGATLGGLESYTDRVAAINGEPSDQKVGFYWQGTDLPQKLVMDNASPHFNETGAPRLAAFDYAVDLEIPSDARTTYVGYSAGGSLLGTGEREGLDSTNIVYVAPAGPGHEVGSPEDTANPDANRYWVQTRTDPISAAQFFGGGSHGSSWWKGGSPNQMGVTRLETGFLDPRNPDSVMGGHEDYFTPASTSAQNISGVINGTKVSLHVEDDYIYGRYGAVAYSPLETSPDDYTGSKLKTITVEELEK
ncbi:hypothetical protein GCM10009582_17210 [Arthrobacter flavus]